MSLEKNIILLLRLKTYTTLLGICTYLFIALAFETTTIVAKHTDISHVYKFLFHNCCSGQTRIVMEY